jgi:predicted dienelactone hydrolase
MFESRPGNIPTQYTTLLEDLASHGYSHFALTPTYSVDVVVFPSGRVAEATPAAKPQTVSARPLAIWSQDAVFVMNRLGQLDTGPGSIFTGHLDLTRLGVFGHSFGYRRGLGVGWRRSAMGHRQTSRQRRLEEC